MEWLTLSQAAEEAKGSDSPISADRLRQLCSAHKLPALMVGKTWVIRRSTWERFRKQERPKRGPKPGSKRKPAA